MNNNQRKLNRQLGALSSAGRDRWEATVIYVFLVAITVGVFAQTLRYEFVNFDDDRYIYNAPAIRAGLTTKGLVLAFTNAHARNWHPLTTISHMLDCQLYGLKAGGHHATNLVLHVIAVLLLFRVLRQMTGAVWKSAIVASLFAVHPTHVESVAWVSERKDVLSAVFFLAMLNAYVRYARAPSVAMYVTVVVLFVGGLMSKPMLVSSPLILLLLDYWPLRRFEQSFSTNRKTARSGDQTGKIGHLFLEKIPLFVLSAASCVITFILQKRVTGAIPPLPFLWRLENVFASYVTYVWETFWPTGLAVFYPHPNDTLPTWLIVLAIIFLLAMTSAAVVFRRQRPYLFTGWLWYIVMLIPVIGLIQVGEQGHADRYTYLAHIGLFLLIVWLVGDVTAVSQFRSRAAVAAGLVIVMVLAGTAFIQASYWRNSEALWMHALAVTSDNDVAHNNLGYLLADRGKVDESISHFQAATEIRSHKTDRHYNVGSALVEMNLADALARKGKPDEAMVHYEQAIRLEPNYADAYYNRGNLFFAKGRIDEAIADWQKTLQLQPNDADAHTGLGNALLRQGSLKEAIAQYEQASGLAPDDPHSRINLAWVLATSSDASIRDGARAVEFAQKAVELSNAKDPKFLRTLAAAYAETGRFSEAIEVAQQAMDAATSQSKLGVAHLLEGDINLYRAGSPLRQAFSVK